MLTEEQKRTAVDKLNEILRASEELIHEITPDMDLEALREALVKERALLQEANNVIGEIAKIVSKSKSDDAQTDRVYY